jgi:glutathione S-transferase
MAAAGLQVFGQPASTDVARVLTCLFEKNLEFELVRIDTFKKSHKLPEFIKLRVCRHFDPILQFLFWFSGVKFRF